MTQGQLIAITSKRTCMLMQGMLTDIPQERFARFAQGQNGPIQANHPAFVYGHLALYPSRMMEFLDLDPQPTQVPAHWHGLFEHGATCQDDADGNLYPTMHELTESCLKGYEHVITAIADCDDQTLSNDLPDERMVKIFPTVGVACGFMLTSHAMLHLGQVSTWRRAEGLGSVM